MHFPTAEFVKPEGTHPDYYIKWESLPYAEATWEDGSIIEKKWPKKIKEFQDREDSKRTPSKHCRVLKHRPKFVQVKSQPVYMGGDQVGYFIYIEAALICFTIHSFHWHVQNGMILCRSQELLPFLSVMYFFLPPFSTNYSSISHLILPFISWSTSRSCCSQIHI